MTKKSSPIKKTSSIKKSSPKKKVAKTPVKSKSIKKAALKPVAKPIEPDQLLQVVDELLGSPHGVIDPCQ